MIVRENIAILVSPFYPLQGQPRSSWIAPINVLPRDKETEVITALTEGCSIRAIERLTGVHRDTIMGLGVRVGNGCGLLHDAMTRGLHVSRIELDEAWSFVAKKQRHLKPGDPADFGDQYVFLALAGAARPSSLIESARGRARTAAPSLPIFVPACLARQRFRRMHSRPIPMPSNKPSESNAALPRSKSIMR